MNLVLGFASINIHKSRRKQEARNLIYLMSLKQLARVLPRDCKLVVVENTGFFSSPQASESGKLLEAEMRNYDHFSLNNNSGKSNKGFGELNMLKAYLELNLHIKFDRIIYLTLRQIHASPYAIEMILSSEAQLVVGNPDFYFLDGRIEMSGKNKQFNDMCFGGATNALVRYSKYFDNQQENMAAQGLSSEQLLWNYINETETETEKLPMLGAIRCAGDLKSDIKAWHYI